MFLKLNSSRFYPFVTYWPYCFDIMCHFGSIPLVFSLIKTDNRHINLKTFPMLVLVGFDVILIGPSSSFHQRPPFAGCGITVGYNSLGKRVEGRHSTWNWVTFSKKSIRTQHRETFLIFYSLCKMKECHCSILTLFYWLIVKTWRPLSLTCCFDSFNAFIVLIVFSNACIMQFLDGND